MCKINLVFVVLLSLRDNFLGARWNSFESMFVLVFITEF